MLVKRLQRDTVLAFLLLTFSSDLSFLCSIRSEFYSFDKVFGINCVHFWKEFWFVHYTVLCLRIKATKQLISPSLESGVFSSKHLVESHMRLTINRASEDH